MLSLISILYIGIIILKNYILDALVSIIKTGRHNLLAKQVNKVCSKGTIVSIRNRRYFKYYKAY